MVNPRPYSDSDDESDEKTMDISSDSYEDHGDISDEKTMEIA